MCVLKRDGYPTSEWRWFEIIYLDIPHIVVYEPFVALPGKLRGFIYIPESIRAGERLQ